MNLTRDRIRSIGWVTLLTLCLALTAALTLRVNAVKSEVHQAESRIVQMRKEVAFLDNEYQTRSSQHQLKTLNDIEFGYDAPRVRQYIEGERKLAVLGIPRAPGAPKQLRVADSSDSAPMVSPVTGQSDAGPSAAKKGTETVPGQGREAPSSDPIGAAIDAERLGERLARIGTSRAAPE